ncbi:glutamate racemase [Mariprofundus micogutta]|uniref:Glutamate racemase n=1 Tax=Mariprofundus micogutta TaxID=1921010 RepID=A0A1L8CJQ1_9PROT|nr:glutamate racemase [Mariprofundus micogutta]GAV19126.1 glutamate racemase [Mariprofundus micogutta]
MHRKQSIGIFDSGVGGLSVLKHIHLLLPAEDLIYVADSAFMPYGCKSEGIVEERCMKIAGFLAEQQCKAIVVACNTATAAAVHRLRESFDIPVIGMEPGVKPAVANSGSGVVGVLATTGTSGSNKFKQLKDRYAEDAKLLVQPCPGLVEEIEKGDLSSQRLYDLLDQYLKPLMEQGVDTLVLGCTHYPFVVSVIRELVGESVTIVDTGDAIARELKRQLNRRDLLADDTLQGSLYFWSSAADSTPVLSYLWGESVVAGCLDI